MPKKIKSFSRGSGLPRSGAGEMPICPSDDQAEAEYHAAEAKGASEAKYHAAEAEYRAVRAAAWRVADDEAKYHAASGARYRAAAAAAAEYPAFGAAPRVAVDVLRSAISFSGFTDPDAADLAKLKVTAFAEYTVAAAAQSAAATIHWLAALQWANTAAAGDHAAFAADYAAAAARSARVAASDVLEAAANSATFLSASVYS